MRELKVKKDLSNIVELREYRYGKIDNRTGELITQGFVYQSKLFSFSENAQRNIIGIFVAKDALSYPVSWNTKNDDETYDLVDATDVTNFFMTALGTKKAHQDSGSALKAQVRDANTVEAVSTIIDNR